MSKEKIAYELNKILLSVDCDECPIREACDIYEKESDDKTSICRSLLKTRYKE